MNPVPAAVLLRRAVVSRFDIAGERVRQRFGGIVN
jgi:hypothetical protein